MNCRAPIPKIRLRSLSSDALAIEAGPKRQRTGALPDATARSAGSGFPTYGINVVGAFHEPFGNKPTPNPSQEGNWPRHAALLLGGAGVGSWSQCIRKKRKRAFHEPGSAAVPAASCGGVSPPARTPGETPGELAGEDACATSAAQFIVPMHGKNGEAAFHEP